MNRIVVDACDSCGSTARKCQTITAFANGKALNLLLDDEIIRMACCPSCSHTVRMGGR